MWFKLDDGLPQSVKVRSLADSRGDRGKRERNSALGALAQIWGWTAHQRTDGFVPASVVEDYAASGDVERLTRPTFGRAPLLHRAGEACRCLDGRRWPDGAAYAVHDYLDRNPSRADHDVAKAQRRELRDRELRTLIRRRDHDCCRYAESRSIGTTGGRPVAACSNTCGRTSPAARTTSSSRAAGATRARASARRRPLG